MFKIARNAKYDFSGQSYAAAYPNLHKYPAAMIPQIGIEILKELNVKKGRLLDPYCGSGSSLAAGLDRGLKELEGFDLNPFAALISQAKFTNINLQKAENSRQILREAVFEFVKKEKNVLALDIPIFTNIGFWFSNEVLRNLTVLKKHIDGLTDDSIKKLFFVAFSETARECSYTRNSEFKLYRMKDEDVLKFNPDVLGVYFDKLFSMFSNAWMGVRYARKVDSMLMGGKIAESIYHNGLIGGYVRRIAKQSEKRALEVSAFYRDLENSINVVADSVKDGGYVVYVVGNRTVKGVCLPTNQFIAEKFAQNKYEHLFTYERELGNKNMPLKNSPSNQAGKLQPTMTKEYIIVCQKHG
ncbi:MAG: modification methylase [Elusimicrobia bacterium]|nr:modification methylase [Elusimicrobiota bacterium]